MPTAFRYTLAAVTFLGLICTAGCGLGKRTEYGVKTSGINGTTSATNAIPGIDEFSVTFVTLNAGPPGGVPFVIWSDLANGSSGHGEAGAGGAFYEGHHRASDGRHIDFRAKTVDGKVGMMSIAGADYDFAKGCVFLVSVRQDRPKVAQVRFDLSGFAKEGLTSDVLKELANSKPEIRAFFEEQNNGDLNNKSRAP